MSRINLSVSLIVLFIVTLLFLFVNKITTPRVLSAEELLMNGFYSLNAPKEFSEFSMLSSNDKVIDKSFLLNKWTLVYFGYTQCPSECPVTLSASRQLYALLRNRGYDLFNHQLLLVTIDPERDTPDSVNKYAQAFDDNFHGARPTRPALLSLASQLDVMVTEPKSNHQGHHTDAHLENHMNNLILINPDGKYVGFFRPSFEPERMSIVYQSVTSQASR